MTETLLNLNTWMLLSPFATDQKIRSARIAQLIRVCKPDYITFQEMWFGTYIKELQNNLHEYSLIPSTKGFFNRGGLVIGVRGERPVVTNRFKPTAEYSLIEEVGGKGFQIMTLASGALLLNTHFYAVTKETEKTIPKTQLGYISTFAKQLGKPIILAGDLNMDQEDFMDANSVFDYTPSPHYSLISSNRYANYGKNHTDRNRKIDYVVGTRHINVIEEVIPNDNLSDHRPILATIRY